MCAIPVFDGNPERLRVDSDGQVGVFPGAIVSTGATITIAAGVLDYGFRTWTVLPDLNALTIVSPGLGPQAVPSPSAASIRWPASICSDSSTRSTILRLANRF